MKLGQLGSFIREQRRGARLSLRKLSDLAGVSNPYLSQIERGLRRPSAEILQAIAKALRISAETLYIQAGILDEEPDQDLVAEILKDAALSERQKQVLIDIYRSFRNAAPPGAESPAPHGAGPIPPQEDIAVTAPARLGSAAPASRPSEVGKREAVGGVKA